MKKIALAIGVIGLSLGGLWLLQGLGIVHLRPVLCVAHCETVEGFSAIWAGTGLIMVVAGTLAIAYALKRPSAK